MDASLAPHVMLAVMWAALANTVPAAFWSAAFLLLPEHAQHRRRCLESLSTKPEIQAFVQVSQQPQDVPTQPNIGFPRPSKSLRFTFIHSLHVHSSHVVQVRCSRHSHP